MEEEPWLSGWEEGDWLSSGWDGWDWPDGSRLSGWEEGEVSGAGGVTGAGDWLFPPWPVL